MKISNQLHFIEWYTIQCGRQFTTFWRNLSPLSYTQKTEAIDSLETVTIYQTAWRHNPEDSNLRICQCELQISHVPDGYCIVAYQLHCLSTSGLQTAASVSLSLCQSANCCKHCIIFYCSWECDCFNNLLVFHFILVGKHFVLSFTKFSLFIFWHILVCDWSGGKVYEFLRVVAASPRCGEVVLCYKSQLFGR